MAGCSSSLRRDNLNWPARPLEVLFAGLSKNCLVFKHRSKTLEKLKAAIQEEVVENYLTY